MGVPMKKSPINEQHTLVKTIDIPKEDPTKIVYAQEIPVGTPEPKYEELKNKKTQILESEETRNNNYKENMKKLVRGVFDYKELSGGTLEFFYNLPFKNEPTIKYTLVDGESYELPKGVVKHLRETGFITVNEYAIDPENPMKKNIKVGKKVLRYAFHPEYDDPDIRAPEESRILQVSRR
jgi:hypothetical protein